MFGRLYSGPDLFDPAIGTDKKGHSVRPGIADTHEYFLTPNAVGLHDLLVLIGKEGERQLVFFDELIVFLYRVSADAQDERALFSELRKIIPKSARFLRASRPGL